MIEQKLGKVILAVQDSSTPGVFYTKQYLSRLRARIAGLMTAITAPTSLQKLLEHNFCNEKLFIG